MDAPNGRSSRLATEPNTGGYSRKATTTAKAATGSSGTSAPPMITSPTTKTMTPATAESPATSRIVARTTGVSLTPKRRSATTRAVGVQTPPGMYFASIDSISDCSATRYGTRIP